MLRASLPRVAAICLVAATVACGAAPDDGGERAVGGRSTGGETTVHDAPATATGAARPDTSGQAEPPDLPTPALPATPTATPRPTPAPTPPPPSLPEGIEPARITIPAIEVDAAVVDLSLGHGDPEVPSEWDDAGWYTATRDPGEIGPAVIAGHVDSRAGPAVFFRLHELEPGDEVVVREEGGEARTFVVERTGQYPKTALPDEVFAFGKPRPELRLITCGGNFDRRSGHYVDNLVVYAAAT